MLRLSALALLVPALALAADPPKDDKKAPLYYPTTVGAKMVMEQKGALGTTESTETVTKVEEKDGVYTVTVETTRGSRAATTSVIQVSDKGVFRVSTDEAKADEVKADPRPVLKLPAKEGDSWKTEMAGPPNSDGKVKVTYTTGKEEEVKVPAGKYKALRVDSESEMPNGRTRKTSVWYAPGVGVVKSVIKQTVGEVTTELKEFTPGKEEKKDDKKKEEPKKDK